MPKNIRKQDIDKLESQILDHRAYLRKHLKQIALDLELSEGEAINAQKLESYLKTHKISGHKKRFLNQYIVLQDVVEELNKKNNTNDSLKKIAQIFNEQQWIFRHDSNKKEAIKTVLIHSNPETLLISKTKVGKKHLATKSARFIIKMNHILPFNPKNFDISDLNNVQSIQNGDELRNINSYDYLFNVYQAILTAEKNNNNQTINNNSLKLLTTVFQKNSKYQANFAYGDLYTEFLLNFENEITPLVNERKNIIKAQQNSKKSDQDKIDEINKLAITQLDPVITAIYKNENKALERTAKLIKPILQGGVSHTSSEIQSAVRQRLIGKSKSIQSDLKNNFNYYVYSVGNKNKTTPQDEGSNISLFKAMLSPNFKPQTTTSMASINNYAYKANTNLPQEIRFGTQGQRHQGDLFDVGLKRYIEGDARASINFEAFLQAQYLDRLNKKLQATVAPTNTKITHVYFNNLGLDRVGFEGEKEKALTEQLHGLEQQYENVAVITLPADKGMFNHHDLFSHERNLKAQVQFDMMLSIATDSPNCKVEIKDFKISDNVKCLLYGENNGVYDAGVENIKMQQLLANSFKALNIPMDKMISKAETEAVYFHFIKYEVTNFILEKLQPESFNMACKDAIDRARVASLYFNLMKSFELGKPISKDDFYQTLHAAATMVKGRGVNSHSQLLWNAVDAWVDNPANKTAAEANGMDWLVQWRDENIPKNSRKFHVNQLKDYIKEYSTVAFFGQNKAAKKLLAIVNNNANVRLDDREKRELHKGELGKIRKALESSGVISPIRKPDREKELVHTRFIL